MSNTHHHRNQKHQHMGESFWSRRAKMGHYEYCTFGKRLTIAKERMEQKQELHLEIKQEEDQ